MRLTIEDYFNNFNISKAEIFFKGIKQKYENIIEDKDNKFKPENLSKYFYDYFLYQEKNDIFEYCNHL